MTEWWQQGDEDVPVAVPRRDVVPEAGFSDPRAFTASPEVTFFVPEWRVKRRKTAIGATAVAIGFFVWGVVDLVKAATGDNPIAQALGMVDYILIGIKTVASVIALTLVWRWANQRDPRDVRTRGLTI